MKFTGQKLPGVFLIQPTPFQDDRGIFRRHFCEREFAEHGIANGVKQANVSENVHAHTLRGFHYQRAPHGEGKTLSCLKGAIYDIVVDLREDSPTYLQWISFELDDGNRHSIHVPPGCANAFLTMQPGSIIQYYCSESYAPAAESGIRFDDPLFGFQWPARPAHISEKDARHPDFKPAR